MIRSLISLVMLICFLINHDLKAQNQNKFFQIPTNQFYYGYSNSVIIKTQKSGNGNVDIEFDSSKINKVTSDYYIVCPLVKSALRYRIYESRFGKRYVIDSGYCMVTEVNGAKAVELQKRNLIDAPTCLAKNKKIFFPVINRVSKSFFQNVDRLATPLGYKIEKFTVYISGKGFSNPIVYNNKGNIFNDELKKLIERLDVGTVICFENIGCFSSDKSEIYLDQLCIAIE